MKVLSRKIVSLRSPARPQFTAEFLPDFKSFEQEGGRREGTVGDMYPHSSRI